MYHAHIIYYVYLVRIFHVGDFVGPVLALKYPVLTPDLMQHIQSPQVT